jgi:hypothetical protein
MNIMLPTSTANVKKQLVGANDQVFSKKDDNNEAAVVYKRNLTRHLQKSPHGQDIQTGSSIGSLEMQVCMIRCKFLH